MPRISHTISIKTKDQIKIMQEGGSLLSSVKEKVRGIINDGVNAEEVENLTTALIEKVGGKPSFKMVSGYHWSTCVNVNEGLVHGIPKKETVFKKGDLVSVDMGMYYKGFHTDTSFSVAINPDSETERFLAVGEKALINAINQVNLGKRIYDLSEVIEVTVTKSKYSPIKALVGHGIGKNLHEEPQIPCFTQGSRETTPIIKDGMALAIEVMYAKGSDEVEVEEDGWTIAMRDGKISALFEETVACTAEGPFVLTQPDMASVREAVSV